MVTLFDKKLLKENFKILILELFSRIVDKAIWEDFKVKYGRTLR